MISLEYYNNIFDSYVEKYDQNDGRVTLKIIHTEAVVSIMEELCRLRRLPDHTAKLALICARFHDIGRFEQLKQYDTFLDHMSVDHAVLSCQVLEENNILETLPPADKKMILTAIFNHNKLTIDPSISQSENWDGALCVELCKLIRDADKCDIFRVFACDDMSDVVGASEEEISGQQITPEVLQSIRNHKCVERLIRKTALDHWIGFLGFFFDLNYPETMEIIKNQGYYRRPFDRIQFKDSKTEKQAQEALSIVEQYMNASGFTIPDSLRNFFNSHPRMALAFSGGTDSAYLLYAAKACGCQVRAYYVSSPFQPAFELEDAKKLAVSLQADMTVLPLNVLDNETVRKNPADRCYYCKNAIFSHIMEAAAKDGFCEIMDGTNASDDSGDRPGMRALKELKVLSPLRQCGITKKALREYSRNAGLFTWKKPAYACLATRLPSGTPITASVLQKIESSESILASMGFEDFRVRVFPDSSDKNAWNAKIQITKAQLPLLLEKHSAILSLLKEHFKDVLLDLEIRTPSV